MTMNKNTPKNTFPNPASAPYRYCRCVLGEEEPSSSTTSPPNQDWTSNFQSNSSVDTATTTSSSSTTSAFDGENKDTIANAKHLVNILPTQNVVSRQLPTLCATLPTPTEKLGLSQKTTNINKVAFGLRPRKRERGHLAIAMEIMDEIDAEVDESEIISDAMDAIDAVEDNTDVVEPYLFEQSSTKLLQPKKKEHHYFSIAEDILRDLGTDDNDDE